MIPVSMVTALATINGLQANQSKAREKEPIGLVVIDRVEATLPFLPRSVDGMVRLRVLTGIRPGELAAGRGRDIETTGDEWT